MWDFTLTGEGEPLEVKGVLVSAGHFELLGVEFTDPPEVYETFTWHFGPRLRVRRLSDGREGELPILDVVLERNGRWKLMNFEE